MGWLDFLIIGIVAVLFGISVYFGFIKKRSGCCGCSGCDACKNHDCKSCNKNEKPHGN